MVFAQALESTAIHLRLRAARSRCSAHVELMAPAAAVDVPASARANREPPGDLQRIRAAGERDLGSTPPRHVLARRLDLPVSVADHNGDTAAEV